MQFTLSELWSHMGLFARLIVGALALMSTASLLVAAERITSFRKSRKASFQFAATVGPFLARGDIDGAAAAAGEGEGYLGRVLGAGLKAWRTSSRVDKDVTFESVARALERGAQREIQLMKRGQGVLGTVSSTAPFVGLLGTVMGIVNSFQAMAAVGLRRPGYGLGGHRRGAHHYRLRASRRHPVRHDVQLLLGLDRRPRRGHVGILERVSGCRCDAAGAAETRRADPPVPIVAAPGAPRVGRVV